MAVERGGEEGGAGVTQKGGGEHYQNRSQEAMIAHANVSTTTRSARGRWQSWRGCWQRQRRNEGKDGTSSLSSSFSHTDDDDEEEEGEENDALTEKEEEETEAEEETEEAEETRLW